eukprot:364612-Chlamydomonas_euryale.AAC.1
MDPTASIPAHFLPSPQLTCSGSQVSSVHERTALMWTPRPRWMPAHFMQMNTPRLTDAQLGRHAAEVAYQSGNVKGREEGGSTSQRERVEERDQAIKVEGGGHSTAPDTSWPTPLCAKRRG